MTEFAPALLTEQEKTAIREGRFELQSMRIRIFNSKREYVGPGVLKGDIHGQLRFVMYSGQNSGSEDFLAELMQADDILAGQLIPKDLTYRLELTDTSERLWTSESVQINTNGTHRGTYVTGTLFELACTTENKYGSRRCSLSVDFPGDYRIPFNTRTEVTHRVNGRRIRTGEWNVLVSRVGRAKVVLTLPGQKRLTAALTVHPKWWQEGLETRLSETLQFVLARPVNWSLLTNTTPNLLQVRIRSIRSGAEASRVQPPIEIQRDTLVPFCDLMDKYFRFVSRFGAPDRLHPISAKMRSILHASSGAIDSEALALCTAAEGLLDYVKEAKLTMHADERRWIAKVKDEFRSRKAPKGLAQRFVGLLGNLEQPSAKMRLKRLSTSGILYPRHLSAWEDLRNRLAHGSTISSADYQKMLDKVDSVLVLYYRLVFNIIGYTGAYTDYSIRGWPNVGL